MTTTETRTTGEIAEEAALWHARLDSGTADVSAFEEWRNADPRHAAAFARIEATANLLDKAGRADLDKNAQPVERRPQRRHVIQWAAVALGLTGVASIWMVTQARSYASTGRGEQRNVVLPDGSRLDLNTDSKVSWKFTSAVREVWLERGEIGLSVASEARPFLVHTNKAQVHALADTDLNLRLRGQAVDLSVLAGACSVSEQPGAAGTAATATHSETPIPSGQGALISHSGVRIRPISAEDQALVKGWRRGELVFTGQTLGFAVGEYNRYLPHPMVIVDPELTDLHLGGRFDTRDPKGFLAALVASFGIRVSASDSGAILLSK